MKAIRFIVKTSAYAIVCFSVLSYLSVMYSLLNREGQPAVNIGWSLRYYEQFWLAGNDLHWGWSVGNFIFDYLIAWGLVCLFFIVRKKSK